jgi:hypothetical protein
MSKKHVKIVRSATLFCDTLKNPKFSTTYHSAKSNNMLLKSISSQTLNMLTYYKIAIDHASHLLLHKIMAL